MSYKTIIAILDTAGQAAKAADFAFDLARLHDAHVVGLHAEMLSAVPITAPLDIPDPIALQAFQDMASNRAREIKALFEQKGRAGGASFDWRSYATSIGYGSSPLAETMRSADLLVAAQADPETLADGGADIGDFLFETGRPVLIIPHRLAQPKPVARALVAWNGSKEAARATFDALPFLQTAAQVDVLSVDPHETATQSPALTGADITAALVRHGIKAVLSSEPKGEGGASAAIEKRLADGSVDLLVMGAYGHSRLWQTLFGGTTRTLLKSMTALTLLSH